MRNYDKRDLTNAVSLGQGKRERLWQKDMIYLTNAVSFNPRRKNEEL